MLVILNSTIFLSIHIRTAIQCHTPAGNYRDVLHMYVFIKVISPSSSVMITDIN